jgi:hypothetical protein
MKLKMGVIAKDLVTGFEGRVTGVASYMTGCDQALLVPNVENTGVYREGHWFDVTRLEVTDSKPLTLPAAYDAVVDPGGPTSDREAPGY